MPVTLSTSMTYFKLCHTYKNLLYDRAHQESLIAQWLERPIGI